MCGFFFYVLIKIMRRIFMDNDKLLLEIERHFNEQEAKLMSAMDKMSQLKNTELSNFLSHTHQLNFQNNPNVIKRAKEYFDTHSDKYKGRVFDDSVIRSYISEHIPYLKPHNLEQLMSTSKRFQRFEQGKNYAMQEPVGKRKEAYQRYVKTFADNLESFKNTYRQAYQMQSQYKAQQQQVEKLRAQIEETATKTALSLSKTDAIDSLWDSNGALSSLGKKLIQYSDWFNGASKYMSPQYKKTHQDAKPSYFTGLHGFDNKAYEDAIDQLALSFKGRSVGKIDTLLKNTGLTASQWVDVQSKIKQLQTSQGKAMSTQNIARVIKGEIEKIQVDSRNEPYINWYRKDGIKTFLKRTGYGAFISDDGNIIPGGTSVGIESEALKNFVKKKLPTDQYSYSAINKLYEQIVGELQANYTKGKTSKQTPKYQQLLKEKTFIEKEIETAIGNTKDQDLLMELFPKKISGVSGGLLGEHFARSYAKDPYYDEWRAEKQSIKTVEHNTASENLSKTYEEEHKKLKEAEETLTQNKALLRELTGEQGSITELTRTLLAPGKSKNERIEAQNTIKTYVDSLVDSFGEEAAQSNIRGELIKNVDSVLREYNINPTEIDRVLDETLQKVGLSRIGSSEGEAARDAAFRKRGIDPAIATKAIQLKKMYGNLVPGRGRSFSSDSEARIEDANALANLLEYSNAFKYQHNIVAQAKAKKEGIEYTEDYFKTYLSSLDLDEKTLSLLQQSNAMRKRYDTVLKNNGSIEDAIDAALGMFGIGQNEKFIQDSNLGTFGVGQNGKFIQDSNFDGYTSMNSEERRIASTWHNLSAENRRTKIIDGNGNVTFLDSPSEKKEFADLVKNQLEIGASSDNAKRNPYLIADMGSNMNTVISQTEKGALSPSGRRIVGKIRNEGWNEDKTQNYGAALKNIDSDNLLKSAEELQAKEVHDRVQKMLKRNANLNSIAVTKNKPQKTTVDDTADQKTTTAVADTANENISQLGAWNSVVEVLNQFTTVVQEASAAITAHTQMLQTDTNNIAKNNIEESKEDITQQQTVSKTIQPLSPSKLIQQIFGDDFGPDDNRFEEVLNKYSLDNGIANAQKLGITEGEGKFRSLASNYYSKVFGTIEHLESQISDEVFNETKQSLDIETINKNSNQYSNKVQKLIQEYNSQKKVFYENLQKLGFTEEDLSAVNKRLSYAVKSQQEIAKLLSATGHANMTEVPLTGEVNEQTIHGITDKLYLNGDTLNISDLKNKYNVKGDRESIQLGMYQTMLTQMKQRVTDFDKGITEKPIFTDIQGKALDDQTNEQLIGILRQAKSFKTYIQNVNGQLSAQLVPITAATTKEIGKAIEMFEMGEVLTDEAKARLAMRSKSSIAGEGGYIPSPNNLDEMNISWFKGSATIAEQNSLISQAVKDQKSKNQVTEQIDLLTRKINDPSRLKSERNSYVEQVKYLQQKLSLLQQTQFLLTQEGQLVKTINGEESIKVSLGEKQQNQLREQLALLENQHKITMAKNSGYTNKDQRGFFGAVFGQIRQTFQYLTRTTIVYGVIGRITNSFSEMIQTVQLLDKAMVDLQIATSNSRSQLEESARDYNDIANEMGRTTQEVMTAANDWLRAGFKTQEANELIRQSMKLSTLGMIDSAQATEYLISTMKGWKLQAEEVSDVVDDLTALDMAFATSAGDIAQAMAKGNVSASLAGVDRKTYEAMLTAVMDVGQQGADVVGTAFKTLFARYGNVKAGKYADTYNLDDTNSESNEETTKLNDVETVLNKVNIKTRDTVGQFRDMDDVLTEVASKWNSMDQVTQNAVTTALGGTRQREVVNTLFENWDSVEKAKEITEQSSGSADDKMEFYTNSIEASQKRLTAALEKLVTGKGLEKVLITTNNTLADLINNLQSVVLIGGSLIALLNRQKIADALLSGGAKLIGGYSNLSNSIAGVMNYSSPTDWFRNFKNNTKNAFETVQMEQFDASLQKLTTSLAKTDVQIAKLGEDALISGQLIVKGMGIEGNRKLAAMSVEDRLSAVNIASTYSPDAVNYALFNKLGLNLADGDKNLQKIMNGLSISQDQAKIKLQEFTVAVQNATTATNNSATSDATESQNSILAAEADLKEKNASELSAAADLQQSAGGQLTGSQAPVVQKILGSNSYGQNASRLTGIGKQALMSTGGMALSMVGTGLTMSQANKLGTGATMGLSAVTSLAPMIGSIIAPGIGTVVGGAISVAAGGLAVLLGNMHKTSEEILQETQKATERLEDINQNITTAEDTKNSLQENEIRFAELVKGVNATTGENISLNESEWTEYQTILSDVISAHDKLYAAYDTEGNLIAKRADGIAELNKVMSESIEVQNKEIQQEKHKKAIDKNEDGYYSIMGNTVAAIVEQSTTSQNLLNDFVKNLNMNFGLRGSNFRSSQFDSLYKKYGLTDFINNTSNFDYNKAFKLLAKNGADAEEIYEVFSSNLPESQSIEDFKKKYTEMLQEFQQQRNSVEQEYRQGLSEAIQTNIEGNENIDFLTEDSQNFIVNSIFGNVSATPFMSPNKKKYANGSDVKTLKEVSKDYEQYKDLSDYVIEWAKNNSYQMNILSSYDTNTAIAADNANKKEILLEMFKGQDYDSVMGVLKGMGYTNINEAIRKDSNGNVVLRDNASNVLQSRRDRTQQMLAKNYKTQWDENTLSELTDQEIAALSENAKEISEMGKQTTSELRQTLKEIILGENATISEYFADFVNTTGASLSDIDGLKAILSDENNKNLFSLQKLKEAFESLGYEVQNVDSFAQTLSQHISTLGSIDINGYTTKTLDEITAQFSTIDSIVSDLSDNGKLSAENMQSLLEDFPEMIRYLSDGQSLLEAMEDLQRDQATLQLASIKNTIATNEESYSYLLDTFKKDGLINEEVQKQLGLFKNSKNISELLTQLYDQNENGEYQLKSRYQNITTMDSSNFAENSWEKIVGQYIFGIDTESGSAEEVSNKISEAVQAQAEKVGMEGTTPELIASYQWMLSNSPAYISQMQQIMDLENQLLATQAMQQLEDAKWEEKVSDAISQLKQDFEDGLVSIDDYIAGLQQISKWANLTAEQQQELNEAIEEAKFDKLSKQFEKGQISLRSYREELSKLMHSNAFGTEDYEKFLEAYLGTYETEINKLEGQRSLLADKDFDGQRRLLAQENIIYEEQLAALEATGLKNTEDQLSILERIKSNKEQILELDKQELEYQKENLETVMNAYSTLMDYQIDRLQKEKDLIEERYDKEIDRLQEINDQKQRSIDLEKYQQELENAKKEKSRVYVAGIGFTYQANQAKVEEAERNLDNYLEERKISDLENAKSKESKYYQDQIDFWNEMKEQVDDVQRIATAEEAVKELVRNGVVQEGSTIDNALNAIEQGVVKNVDGHIVSLGDKFNVFATQYSTTTAALNDLNASMDKRLESISNWVKGYKTPQDLVAALQKAFEAGASKIDIAVPTTRDYRAQIQDIQNKLNEAKKSLQNIISLLIMEPVNITNQSKTWNGRDRSARQEVINGVTYIYSDAIGGWFSTVDPNVTKGPGGTYNIAKGAIQYSVGDSLKSYSSGLEAGIVSQTGLAMLHGTPSKPEYVLNNDQAWQLLRNFATLSLPQFDKNTASKTINYQFYGDLHLPNVQEPSTFFDSLLKQANSQFNISQTEY